MSKLFSLKKNNNRLIIRIFGIKMSFTHKIFVLPYLETHIVNHCNLNCSGCSHYCPISLPEFKNLRKFEEDLEVLSKKFVVQKLFLMGGEPLLHPKINRFLIIARKHLKNTEICVLTNGILLKKMHENFWKTLRETNVKVGLTKYPTTEKYFDELKQLIINNGIEIGAIHDGEKFAFRLSKDAKVEDFQYCPTKKCNNLRDGKIYVCPIGCYMDNFNKYFKTNYPVEGGVSIRFNSADKILQYLKQPSKTCSICLANAKDWIWKNWAPSTKQEKEWFVDNKEAK